MLESKGKRCLMRELKLSDFGLEMVADACSRKGWSPKTVQNWIRAGLLPAVVLGTGRGSIFLVRVADVDAFSPPPRGRPPSKAKATKPKSKGKRK